MESSNLQEQALVCQACQRCNLYSHREKAGVFGHGPAPAPLMVLSYAPSKDAERNGQLFTDAEQELLLKVLTSAQINTEQDVYFSSILKCAALGTDEELFVANEACNYYLEMELAIIQPRVVVTLGPEAIQAFMGNPPVVFSECRGQWQTRDVSYMADHLFILPMLHPQLLLANESREKGSPKWVTWQDIQEVKTALNFYKS